MQQIMLMLIVLFDNILLFPSLHPPQLLFLCRPTAKIQVSVWPQKSVMQGGGLSHLSITGVIHSNEEAGWLGLIVLRL